MFSPLDVLYIVMAFCALWLSAAIFWVIWQVATMIRAINTTVQQAQETMTKIEAALTGIRSKFDHTSSSLGAVMHTATKAVEYLLDKKAEKATKKATKKAAAKKKSATKKKSL